MLVSRHFPLSPEGGKVRSADKPPPMFRKGIIQSVLSAVNTQDALGA
jgi:hypothetical protein